MSGFQKLDGELKSIKGENTHSALKILQKAKKGYLVKVTFKKVIFDNFLCWRGIED